jgi:hypothetical protein
MAAPTSFPSVKTMSDQIDPFSQRLEACPPHLRGRLMRQQARFTAEKSASFRALHEAIEGILARFGPPPKPPAQLTPVEGRLHHRRRWLP